MAAYPVTATSPQRLASGKLPQYSSVGSECSDCGKPIESSYGDPDEDKESEV